MQEEHDGLCRDGSCLNRTLSSSKEEAKTLLGEVLLDDGGKSLPTLGLITGQQKEAAKAHPPPSTPPPPS